MFTFSQAERDAVNAHQITQKFATQQLSAITYADVITALMAVIVKPGENTGPLKYLLNLREILAPRLDIGTVGPNKITPADAAPFTQIGSAGQYVFITGVYNGNIGTKQFYISTDSGAISVDDVKQMIAGAATSWTASSNSTWLKAPVYGACETAHANNRITYNVMV